MHRLIQTLALGLVGFTGLASAQTESVVILTTYPATGSSSTATRIIAPKLQEYLGREIEIDYGVGLQAGVDAPADERTVFVSTIGNMAMLPAILPAFGVDPLSDLRPVTRITAVPDVLIAHSGLGIETLDELLEYASAHPGELTYSHIAPRSIHRLEFAALLGGLGLDISLNESIRGSGPAMDAVANGDLDLVHHHLALRIAAYPVRCGSAAGRCPSGANSPAPGRADDAGARRRRHAVGIVGRLFRACGIVRRICSADLRGCPLRHERSRGHRGNRRSRHGSLAQRIAGGVRAVHPE